MKKLVVVGNGQIVRMDRLTGRAWRASPAAAQWHEIKEPQPPTSPEPLPERDQNRELAEIGESASK